MKIIQLLFLFVAFSISNLSAQVDKTILTKNPLTEIEVEQGHFTQYMIRFQNTGTSMATNIAITDTISSDHLLSTFKVIATSHGYRTEMDSDGNLEVFFDNIFLQDSTSNEALSHGFFLYELQLDPDMPTGRMIENTAHISFDSNPAVVTNTTMLSIESPNTSSIEDTFKDLSGAKIYPNPVSDILKIDLSVERPIEVDFIVFDLSGKLMQTKKAKLINGSQTVELDCQGLSVGNYSLVIISTEGSEILPFAKVGQ